MPLPLTLMIYSESLTLDKPPVVKKITLGELLADPPRPSGHPSDGGDLFGDRWWDVAIRQILADCLK